MTESVKIGIRTEVVGLAADHPVTQEALDEFASDAREVPGLSVEEGGTPASGAKGGVSELILAPGAPSAAWAVVALVKLWLRRDRSRSMTITIRREGDDPLTVTVSGEQISTQALETGITKAFGDAEGATRAPEAGEDMAEA
ncbi:effector-associated constant component EACC1 [Streptomyces bauhiniae]